MKAPGTVAQAMAVIPVSRSSRSVRQCIALKAKLLRDQVRHDREDQAHASRQADTRIQIRKAQVRLSVERAVWNEADGPEAERLLTELDDILEAETFSDDFLQGLVQTHIARICEELGVTPPGAKTTGNEAAAPAPTVMVNAQEPKAQADPPTLRLSSA